MALKFNPLTGNFDFTGSGGGGASYIDGEVNVYADLSLDAGVAPLNTAWLVRTASGVWPVTRKQAGIYIRTATGGSNRDSDYTYAGTLPDVFSDSQFLLYDNSDSSRNLAFDLGSISTGQTRTLTVADASGRIQVEGQAIGNTTAAAGTFTTLTANTSLAVAGGIVTGASNVLEMVNGSNAQTLRIYSSYSFTNVFGRLSIRGANPFSGNHIIATEKGTLGGAARGLDLQTDSVTRLTLGETGGVTVASGNLVVTDNTGGETATFDAQGKLSANRLYDLPNASGTIALTSDFAAPPAIGSTTPAAGTFTTLTANTSLTLNGTGAAELVNEGAAAGPLRIYNTFTSATNHERGFMRWSSNVFQIGTEKGSGSPGGTARALEFQTDGVTRLTLNATGNVGINTSSPSQRLEVRGDALISSSAAWAAGQTARLYFGDTGHSLQVPHTGNATWFNYNGIVFSNAVGTPFAMGTSAIIGGSTTIALGGAITNFSTFAGASVVVSSTVATLKDTLNIAVGTTTGTKIGTATTQKIGFFNATPVVQQAAVADATDAASTQARLNDLLARLRTLGLIAT